MLSRTTIRASSLGDLGGLPAIRSRAARAASRPLPSRSCATVVSGGFVLAASSTSSKPTMDSCPGTGRLSRGFQGGDGQDVGGGEDRGGACPVGLVEQGQGYSNTFGVGVLRVVEDLHLDPRDRPDGPGEAGHPLTYADSDRDDTVGQVIGIPPRQRQHAEAPMPEPEQVLGDECGRLGVVDPQKRNTGKARVANGDQGGPPLLHGDHRVVVLVHRHHDEGINDRPTDHRRPIAGL